MSDDLRQGQFSGVLVRNSEYSNDRGFDMLKFTIAVEKYVRPGQAEDNSMYVQCTLFGKRASALEDHLRKGTTINVAGEIWLRQWVTKQGKPGAGLQMTVSQFSFQRASAGKSTEKAVAPQRSKPKPETDDEDDDVPF